jgi:hypothetical protein
LLLLFQYGCNRNAGLHSQYGAKAWEQVLIRKLILPCHVAPVNMPDTKWQDNRANMPFAFCWPDDKLEEGKVFNPLGKEFLLFRKRHVLRFYIKHKVVQGTGVAWIPLPCPDFAVMLNTVGVQKRNGISNKPGCVDSWSLPDNVGAKGKNGLLQLLIKLERRLQRYCEPDLVLAHILLDKLIQFLG